MTFAEFRVVWPQSPRGGIAHTSANRLADLSGKRIAFLWDYLFRGEAIFGEIEVELKRRFAGIEIVGYEEFGNIHGDDEVAMVADLPRILKERRIDAAVVGNGC